MKKIRSFTADFFKLIYDINIPWETTLARDQGNMSRPIARLTWVTNVASASNIKITQSSISEHVERVLAYILS